MTSPYDIYEQVVGKYDPDNPPSPPFSVWLSGEREQWLRENPGITLCDGHIFYDKDLHAFHTWVMERQR